jgi:enamine deaminase RidA (YjgF/YER057c/UK114 family)
MRGTPPASTPMIVSGLTRLEFKIEVEAIAARAGDDVA